MTEIRTRVLVGPDHRISGTAPAAVPRREHEVAITLTFPPTYQRPLEPFDIDALPAHDLGPCPERLSLRREDLYDEDGRRVSSIHTFSYTRRPPERRSMVTSSARACSISSMRSNGSRASWSSLLTKVVIGAQRSLEGCLQIVGLARPRCAFLHPLQHGST
jgi:hypothetical protein